MEPLLNLTYEEHFKSNRPDGRFVSTFAAHMQWLRDLKPELALPQHQVPGAQPYGALHGAKRHGGYPL